MSKFICRQCRNFVEVLSEITLRNPSTGEFEKTAAYHCDAFGLPIASSFKISCRYFEPKEDAHD